MAPFRPKREMLSPAAREATERHRQVFLAPPRHTIGHIAGYCLQDPPRRVSQDVMVAGWRGRRAISRSPYSLRLCLRPFPPAGKTGRSRTSLDSLGTPSSGSHLPAPRAPNAGIGSVRGVGVMRHLRSDDPAANPHRPGTTRRASAPASNAARGGVRGVNAADQLAAKDRTAGECDLFQSARYQ